MQELTFGSLFSGVGGFDLGFERAGWGCAWQVEIDPYCNQVLEKHWPHVRRHDDIRTFDASDFEHVDAIIGGFPCQDVAWVGHGDGINGSRSGLFREMLRVVRDMEPRFVVLENVAALLDRGIREVLGALATLGFDAEWNCYRASQFGAPHLRDRVFILAYRPADAPEPSGGRVLANAGSESRFIQQPLRHAYQAELADGGAALAGDQLARLPDYGQASTGVGAWAAEPGLGRLVCGAANRMDRHRALGNIVVPEVAEYLARRLVTHAALARPGGER